MTINRSTRSAGAHTHTRPALATEPDITARLDEVLLAQGLIAERLPGARLLYLALTSRLLKRPVSVVIRGSASAGKSWMLDAVLALFGDDAYCRLSAFSPKALVHGKESLVHRTLVLAESSGVAEGFGAFSLRSLLSEHELSFEITEKDPRTKQFKTRVVRRPGPTNLLSTNSGLATVHDNETRVLSFELDDSPAATQAVVDAWAARAAGEGADEVDPAPWRELQQWLANGERRVVIPFAKEIASRLGATHATRITRDWIQVLSLIEASALLHRESRERDTCGRVIAEMADYAIARKLAEPIVAAGLEATVKPAVRALVTAVAELEPMSCGGVDQRTVSRHLHKSPQSLTRPVRDAIEAGYLVDNETRPRRPSKLVIGAPLPDDATVLPPVEVLS
jgi:hypothetical protein